MRKPSTFWFTIAFMLMLLTSSAKAQNFLQRPASSVSDFWSKALLNPAKFNYETYYRTPVTLLRSRWGYLSRVRLGKTATYTMTFTNGRGWFYSNRVTLSKNTAIFVDAWNRPVVEANTGNPIR